MKSYLFSPSFGWKVNNRDKAPCQRVNKIRALEVDQLLSCSSEYFPPLPQMAPNSESGLVLWGWRASYPRVIWSFITESIVRYIDFQNLHLFFCTFYLFLIPQVGQKCGHGSSARKTRNSYCASPILSWDGVRNTISMSIDKELLYQLLHVAG